MAPATQQLHIWAVLSLPFEPSALPANKKAAPRVSSRKKEIISFHRLREKRTQASSITSSGFNSSQLVAIKDEQEPQGHILGWNRKGILSATVPCALPDLILQYAITTKSYNTAEGKQPCCISPCPLTKHSASEGLLPPAAGLALRSLSCNH